MSPRIGIAALIATALLIVGGLACEATPASPSQAEPATTQPAAPALPSQPAVPAAPAVAKITGSVTYRQRIALLPNAVVEVKLIDVSRADAPAVTIGEHVIENPGQVPIAFEIEYNPEDIDERFSYAVQARITEEGKLRFINDTRYSVITRGSPTHVDMVLVMVAAAAPPEPAEPKMADTPAPVESVKVVVSETDPTLYTLQIVSGLPGGCAKFKDYTTSLDSNTFTVNVTNLVPADPVPCTMIYGRHEGKVSLDYLTSGEAYTVVVNGKLTNSFTVPDLEGPKIATAVSPIERVEVAVSESDLPEYSLQIVSRLPKGSSCSRFNGYDIAYPAAGLVHVSVTHFEVTEMMPCTADLPVVLTEVALGTDFMPGESYRVVVNDEVTNAFTARDPEGPKMVVKESPVEGVELLILESFPPQYRLKVLSALPLGSSCSKFNGYDISRPFANTIQHHGDPLGGRADERPVHSRPSCSGDGHIPGQGLQVRRGVYGPGERSYGDLYRAVGKIGGHGVIVWASDYQRLAPYVLVFTFRG